MEKKSEIRQAAGISRDAVKKATGKSWSEWFAILDRAGARKMAHPEIVAHLRRKHKVRDWWQQMVTVAYEQTRGLRQKHETGTGFQSSASKTVGVSVAKLYVAWTVAPRRRQWLGKTKFHLRKATRNKSIRASLGKHDLSVNFWRKGAAKSQVTVEQTKLPNARAVARIKKFWASALSKLQKSLEG